MACDVTQFWHYQPITNHQVSKLWSNHSNSVQTQGKIVTNKVFFSSSFKYLCKTAVDWVNKVSWISDMVRVQWRPVILLELTWNDPWWRSLLRSLFCTITYGKVSLWLWKSLGNLENFFSFFVATHIFRRQLKTHFFCEILTRCTERVRDFFENALYKLTLYLLTYLPCHSVMCFVLWFQYCFDSLQHLWSHICQWDKGRLDRYEDRFLADSESTL